PARAASPGAAWQEIDDDTPFVYRDTATSRAGLAAVNRRYRGHRIVIVGLGGTGSYILDQVSKTEVDSILLVDGDTLDNHNAFRAPGAASLETLRNRPIKAAHFAAVYSNMHRGITTCEDYLDEDNLEVLEGATFVFLASDDAAGKPVIMDWLEARDVPFIDVGLGVDETDGRLGGLLRVTTSLPGRREQARRRIPIPAPERDDYGRNIQTADLAKWAFAYDGEKISLTPSIGNWSLSCRSHYWIRKGAVQWSRRYSPVEVAENRECALEVLRGLIRWRGGGGFFWVIGGVSVEPGQQIVQVGCGELPLERLCRGVVAVFEGPEPVSDLVEVGEVVGCHDFAPDDGEEDLDLVRPGGVDGVWTMMAFGNAAVRRSMAFFPRWEEPLSTIQKTRVALA
ncbi:DUF6527 family protein, partial [Streptomyces sp. 1222.5]|uniref:DUF6527 family protein n=1 Tax=Streptomyces sp. 1222.5 TaxID=1881026 RepID=UPI003EBEFE0A